MNPHEYVFDNLIISTVQLASAEADFASFTNYTPNRPNLICTMPKQQTKREFPSNPFNVKQIKQQFPPPTFPTNPEVAQQLSDLLQCFPAAAIGGVQWKTLLQKYEEGPGIPRDLGSTDLRLLLSFETVSEDVQQDLLLADQVEIPCCWPGRLQE
jgi:hypothetical protein